MPANTRTVREVVRKGNFLVKECGGGDLDMFVGEKPQGSLEEAQIQVIMNLVRMATSRSGIPDAAIDVFGKLMSGIDSVMVHNRVPIQSPRVR